MLAAIGITWEGGGGGGKCSFSIVSTYESFSHSGTYTFVMRDVE